MRRRSRQPKDSLDLLLDTMCNAFGGIVLIAILVALLIEKPGDESSQAKVSGKESLEKLRKARELQELEEELQDLQTRWETNKDLIELIEERDRLAGVLSNRQEIAALSVVNFNERFARALEEKETLLTEIDSLQRELAALESRIAEKQEAVDGVQSEMKKLVASRMSETRPPELRDAAGGQVNLIVQYGEVFPVVFYGFNESGEIYSILENEQSIEWQGPITKPSKGKGWNIKDNLDALETLISGVSRYNKLHEARPSQRFHVLLFVYGDSFTYVDDLLGMIEKKGNVARGWQPIEEKQVLAFSIDGEKGQVE